jgi:hypothetical protein
MNALICFAGCGDIGVRMLLHAIFGVQLEGLRSSNIVVFPLLARAQCNTLNRELPDNAACQHSQCGCGIPTFHS